MVDVTPEEGALYASPADGCSDAASLEMSLSSSNGTHSNPERPTQQSPSPQPPERVTYTVGDHCFFETSVSGPYQIRRLDEFVKNGNSVDVKVFIYSRKSDLPFAVQKQISGFIDGDLHDSDAPLSTLLSRRDAPTNRERRRLVEHLTSSREAFLNKDEGGPVMETLPTSLIRGKCSVLHHVDGSPKSHYTKMENVFFYQQAWYLSSDLQPGEVVIDREKQIHHDSDHTYQAITPNLLTADERLVYSSSPDKASLIWTPNRLKEEDVPNFVQVAVAVGLVARCLSSTRAASLALREEADIVARIASMDCTIVEAHSLLHQNGYDLERAMDALVGQGFWSKRALLETFDENDMTFFRIGLHETGRDLKKIHQEWLPWRTFADIVAFYYLFKSTRFYKQFRSRKASDKRSKGIVTSISVANYIARSCLLRNVPDEQICYGCYESSDVWYAWTGLSRNRRQVRAMCPLCWDFWKRYGCLKRPWRGPPATFRSNAKGLPGKSGRPTADTHQCLSPKPTVSAGKQFLLTHRSPPAPLNSLHKYSEYWPRERSQSDEEEFEYTAGDEWRLARRVASESLYDPKQLARYPLLACGDTKQTNEYFRTCPGLVVNYYAQSMGRKRAKMDEVISRISLKKQPVNQSSLV